MTPDQEEAVDQCLEELIVLGQIMEAAGFHHQPGTVPARWFITAGSIVHRLATQAMFKAGDLPAPEPEA